MQLNISKIGVKIVINSPFLYTNMVSPLKIEDDLSKTPSFWIGDAQKGNEILRGIFNWDEIKEIEELEELGLECPWDHKKPSHSWLEYAHSFEWIYDVRATSTSISQERSVDWVEKWLKKYKKVKQPIWRSDIVARRLSSWLANFNYITANMNKRANDAFIDSISMHIGHLIFTNSYDCTTEQQKLTAKRGLIIGLLASNNKTVDVKFHLNEFYQILEDNLNGDGMNKFRNIPVQVSFAKDAFMVQSMLNKLSINSPDSLDDSIVKILSVLKVFTCSDGSFAHFAGAGGSLHYLKQILNRYARKIYNTTKLEETGFYNVIAGKTQVLFDCSNRSETIYDDAGILSFEMNHAKQRIFANCGYYKNLDTPMYNACKNTAAHNTITVNNYNALSIGNRSRITKVKGSLINDKGWSLLQGSHDGFEKITNSLLKRVIAINENGTEIIGEDSFELLVGIHDITSRFHLHPDVKVSILSSKHEAMLQVGKQGWKFKIEGGKLSLQPSFFVDAQGNSRKTNQLVFETKSISQYVTMRWHISLQ